MLPVQKKIKDEQVRPAQATQAAILSQGNMVNAADELCQRLKEIDLDQITSAAERLSVSKAGLLDLQRALGIVSEMAACQSKVNQAATEKTAELNDLRTKIFENLAQLRRNAEKPSVFVADASFNSENDQFPTADFKHPLPPEAINLAF